MTDKVGIKIDPKTTISIHIGATPIDILPLLQRGLTGDKNQKKRHRNDTKNTPIYWADIKM